MIAFGNLLKTAMGIIPPEKVQYASFIGNTLNSLGIDVPQYSDKISIQASVQPVTGRMYAEMGLQLGKNYVTLYIPANIAGVSEKSSNDAIFIDGKKFNIIATDNWHNYDGWNKVLCVEEKHYED